MQAGQYFSAACTILILDIVFWNYLYLSEYVINIPDDNERGKAADSLCCMHRYRRGGTSIYMGSMTLPGTPRMTLGLISRRFWRLRSTEKGLLAKSCPYRNFSVRPFAIFIICWNVRLNFNNGANVQDGRGLAHIPDMKEVSVFRLLCFIPLVARYVEP